MADFSKIKQKFDADFEPWGIQLAPEKLTPNSRGKIQEAGWTIEYLISADEKGVFLDYYSTHRMTSDTHKRFYADGSVMELPALAEMCIVGKEEEFQKRNREVDEMLRAKGFGG
jgi:hypothetical protein